MRTQECALSGAGVSALGSGALESSRERARSLADALGGRPCVAKCEPLARGRTNCHADVSRRRALTRRSDAQAVVTVLGTLFGAQKIERPL